MPRLPALVAQWIEHLLAEQGVARSSRAESAKLKNDQQKGLVIFQFLRRMAIGSLLITGFIAILPHENQRKTTAIISAVASH